MFRFCWIILALSSLAFAQATPALKRYESTYYEVLSDLEPQRVREAILRMDRMAEEYSLRTREFSGRIRAKFPFYLFKDVKDFEAAGGFPGSAGSFLWGNRGNKLLAVANEKMGDFTWHVLQHEGFHQFAHHVIGQNLPPWLNEGLAEYFGVSLFTGDGFVAGIIPADRLPRIQNTIRARGFAPMRTFLGMSQDAWNDKVTVANYDQAWTMVHYLAHGNNGQHQAAFVQFIKAINRGDDPDKAWEQHLGAVDDFEKNWAAWWLAQQPGATRQQEAQAVVSTLTSFLGRASASQQTFADLETFIRAGAANSLKFTEADWLPPGLFAWAARRVEVLSKDVRITLIKDAKPPQITVTLPDKTTITAKYQPSGRQRIAVEVDDLPVVIEQARALIAQNKKDEARAMLLERIRKLPNSPHLEESRKVVRQAMQK